MVVWQGVTSDGTATPVQVTDEGKVIAIGQEGPAGPPGPEGQEGPPGPPGANGADGVQWPPNAFEGAFLMYLDGVVQWATPEEPIIPPQEWIGPITEIDSDGSVLIFEDFLSPDQFLKGTQVIAVNEFGQEKSPPGFLYGPWLAGSSMNNLNPSVTVSGTPEDLFSTSNSGIKLNGYNDGDFLNYQGIALVNLPWEKLGLATLTVFYTNNSGRPAFADQLPNWDSPTGKSTWFNNGHVSGNYEGTVQYECVDGMAFNFYGYAQGTTHPENLHVTKIQAGGKTLIDGYYAQGDVMQVVNNALVLRSTNGNFEVGDYVKTTDVAYATWLAASRGYSVADLKNPKK